MKELIQWSTKEFSHLPWRQNRGLYQTLVSEIMLQQTTVATVLNHFDRFLTRYPTIESLAKTSEEEIRVQWKGLGYYRRAKNLRLACIEIHNNHNSEIPLDYLALTSIKGIGDYTASALLAIGSNKPHLAIDANLRRVLSRYLGIAKEQLSDKQVLEQINLAFESNTIIDRTKFRSYRKLNEALMDLGRVICRARSADCSLCPLAPKCITRSEGLVTEVIQKSPKKISRFYKLELNRFIVTNRKGEVLASKKTNGQWLEGQLELPTTIQSSEESKLSQYPILKVSSKPSFELKSKITKFNIVNRVHVLTHTQFKKLKLQGYCFFPKDHEALSVTCTKILNQL